jgi:hypothetical protein
VPPDDFLERASESGKVEGAFEADPSRNVVQRAPGNQLIEEPESLLCEGDGKGARLPPLLREELLEEVTPLFGR